MTSLHIAQDLDGKEGIPLDVLIERLADKSVLRRNRDEQYELHELARQYPADRLQQFAICPAPEVGGV